MVHDKSQSESNLALWFNNILHYPRLDGVTTRADGRRTRLRLLDFDHGKLPFTS